MKLPLNLPFVIGDEDLLEWQQSKTSDPVYLYVDDAFRHWIDVARNLPNRKGTTLIVGARGL